MQQMTAAQARVIDPVLTNLARGYKNMEMVGGSLFPTVPVMQRGGKVVGFRKEDFRLYSTGRSPGQNTKRLQFGYDAQSFALEQHALEGMVPFELLEEANAVPGIDMAKIAVMKTQNTIALRLEKAQADVATNASLYAASHKVTLSGTSQWSDPASDPVGDVETAKQVIRAATGKRPNTMLVGAAVEAALMTNPQVIDRMSLFTGTPTPKIPTREYFAALFGVQKFVVGDAIYQDAADTVFDVWGKFAILAYTELGSIADMGLPSYGYTYQLRNYPIVESPYQDRNAKSWLYPVTDEVMPVIAGADAGYLFSAAVA